MHTKCPNCKALFRINVTQLQQAQGRVRCGQCSVLFDAQRNIVLPKAGEVLSDLETLTGLESGTQEKRFVTALRTPSKTPAPELEEIPIPKLIPESDVATPRQPPATRKTIPQPASGTVDKSENKIDTETIYYPPSRPVILGLGCMALVFLLLVQFFYFHRNRLTQYPLLARLMEEACDTVGCEIEPIRDIDRIEIIDRNVFSHPRMANALMITATFANVAPFPQPYPIMQVSLTDLQGKTVAARRFLPQEYLNRAEENPTLMEPGVPVDVNIAVHDPKNGAMAFEFAFFDFRGPS